MKETDLRQADLETIHKIVWLMNEYPGKTINEFCDTFLVPEMGIFNINNAIWRAVELGYIVIDDPDFDGTGSYKVDRVPEKYQFGEDIESLMVSVPYLVAKLNVEEGDIMEAQLQKWFAPNYARYDTTIALKRLLNDKVIFSYDLTNVNIIEPSKKGKKHGKDPKEIRDTYTFYTLYENGEQRWGVKQFPDQSKVE